MNPFKLPKLPQFSAPSSTTAHGAVQKYYKDIPCFQFQNFRFRSLIGAGGFGKVYHGVYKGKDIVLKKCEDAEEGHIIKEGRFIHKLQHKNLVKFNAVFVAEKALMMIWYGR